MLKDREELNVRTLRACLRGVAENKTVPPKFGKLLKDYNDKLKARRSLDQRTRAARPKNNRCFHIITQMHSKSNHIYSLKDEAGRIITQEEKKLAC